MGDSGIDMTRGMELGTGVDWLTGAEVDDCGAGVAMAAGCLHPTKAHNTRADSSNNRGAHRRSGLWEKSNNPIK